MPLPVKWKKRLMEQVMHDYEQYDTTFDKSDIESALSKIKVNKAENDYIFIQIVDDIPSFSNLHSGKVDIDSDPRLKHYFDTLHETIKYAKEKQLPPISGLFVFKIGDGYNYLLDVPVINWSKPENKKGFLFPDWIFSQIKQRKHDYTANRVSFKKKINTIYFRGRSSTHKTNKVREKMQDFKSPFTINITHDYEPYFYTAKYKYLLDLPGRKPWSVRLYELLLSRSLVIRVRFYREGEPWIVFYDRALKNQHDYVELKYSLNYDKEIDDRTLHKIRDDIEKVYEYYENNESQYKRIARNSFRKALSLTKKHIYFYVYNMLVHYCKLIKFDLK